MIATLALSDSATQVDEYHLRHFPQIIGRSLDADITLNDRWVSRRHCEIDLIDGQLVVRDLGSKHGTLINHVLIDEAPLLPGDKLNVGLTTFVANYEIANGESVRLDAARICDS